MYAIRSYYDVEALETDYRGDERVATKLSTIESYLIAERLKYSVHDDYIRTSFATDLYRDQDGDAVITSYSIHYTKLYERSARPADSGRGSAPSA